MHNSIKSILTMSPVMPVLVINKVDKVEHLFEALIKLKSVDIVKMGYNARKLVEEKFGLQQRKNVEDLSRIKLRRRLLGD